ncbi:prepilin peptidase [Sporolactobacillus vineae]|uniref:prepilin peptidase n=1 Tax=Sporolactobacillus vineae TaxID=444463 RepID=UPI00047474CE|nr:A24 family peptidase [Sporolactobacillus vineae]
MHTIFSIYFLILGFILGSFYNVVGLRVPEGQSIITPPSHCPSCGRRLTIRDLVPVFSYIFLKGKCRTCGSKISPVYPIIELTTGLLFLFSFLRATSVGAMLAGWLLISLLIIVLVSDLAKMIIPDKVLLWFLPIFILFRVIVPLQPWWDSLLGAASGFLLLAAIALISRGGMGGGDVKLFALIGLFTGTKIVLLGFMLSAFFGAFFGIIAMMLGLVKRRQPIPFAPFIMLGVLTAYFFGEQMISFYLSLLY